MIFYSKEKRGKNTSKISTQLMIHDITESGTVGIANFIDVYLE